MANEVRLLLGAATDVGEVREVNEDSHGFVRCSLGDLLVVCDGMGGHAAGDVASQTARDAILSHALTSRATDEAELLREAIIAGHSAVRAIADASPDRTGMGTTVVAALVRADWAWIANVGDSRCYLVRDGQSTMLSKDQTKGQRLLDSGIITATQLETHPEKGVLTQALGQRANPQAAVTAATRLRVGDALVLCSDGVYESMHHDIAAIAAAKNPNYAAHDLVIQAVERDGKDNATVVVGRYADLGAAALPASAPSAAHVETLTWRGHGRAWWLIPAAFIVLAVGFFIGRGCTPDPVKTPARPVKMRSPKVPAGQIGPGSAPGPTTTGEPFNEDNTDRKRDGSTVAPAGTHAVSGVATDVPKEHQKSAGTTTIAAKKKKNPAKKKRNPAKKKRNPAKKKRNPAKKKRNPAK